MTTGTGIVANRGIPISNDALWYIFRWRADQIAQSYMLTRTPSRRLKPFDARSWMRASNEERQIA
jgi:hypothetical protein